ncbi:FG-GAP repeat domain-containing protein [Agrobacterium sp. rho-13.3]|uniref:FG-GAP repeat domain-containing protein n=1 Tax=Agrobacterium sp. rho-13.3 TaxID=3072980 RepID=UPI002A161C8C|nr:VCBS repeat-containing protein [Agrobacterium sp. rho-13.3]MDX8308128.1 VCBS repeat-containing protein [Agrobacterium sp. rho-13.3]
MMNHYFRKCVATAAILISYTLAPWDQTAFAMDKPSDDGGSGTIVDCAVADENASSNIHCVKPLSTWPLPNPSLNNVTFSTLPSHASGKTGQRGYVIDIRDVRYLDFNIPETRFTPVDCSRVKQSMWPNVASCSAHTPTCGEIFSGDATTERLSFPTWPLSNWHTLRPGMPQNVPSFAINTNHFDLRGFRWPEKPDDLPGGVSYNEPCSKPFGASISNGFILADPNTPEIDVDGRSLPLSDALALFPSASASPIAIIPAAQISSSGAIFGSSRAVIAGNLTFHNGTTFLADATKPLSPVGRTAIGLTPINNGQSFRMVILVVQNGRRGTGGDTGFTVPDVNNYLRDSFGSQTVFVLDGSGSSQFVSSQPPSIGALGSVPFHRCVGAPRTACTAPGDQVGNRDRERPIPTFLNILAPGNQIEPPRVAVTQSQSWTSDMAGWTSNSTNPRFAADVNGDGRNDLIGFGTNSVIIDISTGSSFYRSSTRLNDFTTSQGWSNFNEYPRLVGDVDRSGHAAIVGFTKKSGQIRVSRNSNGIYINSENWSTDAMANWPSWNTFPRMLGDVDGDGRQDIVGFGQTEVFVALSTGAAFSPSRVWSTNFTVNQGWTTQDRFPRLVGDVDGDGRADIVGFNEQGNVVVSRSTGQNFAQETNWLTGQTGWTSQDTLPRFLQDMNGDGKADVVWISARQVLVSFSTGTSFTSPSFWSNDFSQAQGWASMDRFPRLTGDFNGDGVGDLLGFGNASNPIVIRANTSGGPFIPK